MEALLTHLGIPEEQANGTGKSSPIILHRRIELFTKQNPEVGNQLMALKWLREHRISRKQSERDDILDGLELLEHSLIEVLEKRSDKMATLAKKLIDKHNPKST